MLTAHVRDVYVVVVSQDYYKQGVLHTKQHIDGVYADVQEAGKVASKYNTNGNSFITAGIQVIDYHL